MIVLFTDFGPSGPYVGQLKAVLYGFNPGIPVIDLLADAPSFDPRASAYLLAAYAPDFPRTTVFLCVVDPGVGGPRAAIAVRIDGRWFVGPDNGLFNVVAMRGREVEWWDVAWRPQRLSATFHGRDVFAPVAARLARGEAPPGERRDAAARVDRTWPEDYHRIVYIDHFGNAITGVRAAAVRDDDRLRAGGRLLRKARTYAEVSVGEGFWYENANGLVEIAVNRGNASEQLGLRLGEPVAIG